MANWGSVLAQVMRAGADLLRSARAGGTERRAAAPARRTGAGEHSGTGVRSAPTRDRARTVVYAPDLDGAADPGEIVWAWVPFEEGDGRGKDRPLLVVGRAGGELLGLMLSSQHDHADDPNWLSVGSGDWDRQRRESFVRLDRVLEVGEHATRREGAVLDAGRFEQVAAQLRAGYGWH
jgi:hypothetical protein